MNIQCRSFRKGTSAFFFPFFLTLLLFFSPLLRRGAGGEAFSQALDTLVEAFSKKPHLIGGFATKSTFIGGFRSPIFTARAGLDWDNRVRLGAGISWLDIANYQPGIDNTPFYLDKTFTDASGVHTVHPKLEFRYINFFAEYVYFKTKKWQFSIPIQFGIGDSRYRYNYNGENVIEARRVIFLYEPAVSGQYKIIRWFGVGLDVGYRIMIASNKNIGTKFNSPVYDIKALIYWGELYNLFFRSR